MMVSLECDMDRTEVMVNYQQVPRSDLFFKKWPWAVSWYQYEISVLRYGLDPDQVTQVLERRVQYEKQRWDNNVIERRLRPSFRSVITPEIRQNIEAVRQWLSAHQNTVKTVFYPGQIVVFTGDQCTADAATELAKTITHGTILMREANVCRNPGHVYLKNPHDYAYRSYLKAQALTSNAKTALKYWIENMGHTVRPCPSLKNWLNGQHSQWHNADWTWDHYFVDHNDPKLDVWMSMISTGLVRKTMPIVSDAK